MSEICNVCGESVAWGSGKYVNRVPDCNTVEERKDMNVPHPEGDFICGECEEEMDQEAPRCSLCGFVMDELESGLSCQNTACPNCHRTPKELSKLDRKLLDKRLIAHLNRLVSKPWSPHLLPDEITSDFNGRWLEIAKERGSKSKNSQFYRLDAVSTQFLVEAFEAERDNIKKAAMLVKSTISILQQPSYVQFTDEKARDYQISKLQSALDMLEQPIPNIDKETTNNVSDD
ncbi:MAG: hypothetical protein WAW23_05605 [Candidatus Methanoperedens sp.]